MKKVLFILLAGMFFVACGNNDAEKSCENYLEVCKADAVVAAFAAVPNYCEAVQEAADASDAEITDAQQKVIDCQIEAADCAAYTACSE